MEQIQFKPLSDMTDDEITEHFSKHLQFLLEKHFNKIVLLDSDNLNTVKEYTKDVIDLCNPNFFWLYLYNNTNGNTKKNATS